MFLWGSQSVLKIKTRRPNTLTACDERDIIKVVKETFYNFKGQNTSRTNTCVTSSYVYLYKKAQSSLSKRYNTIQVDKNAYC